MIQKTLRSDKLDELANSISDDMLHSLLEVNSLKQRWQYSRNSMFKYVDDFRSWFNSMFGKDQGNICLIMKDNEPNTYYSTFVLFDDPEKLYTILSKTLKLRVFI
jgi:hypothetical protein